MSRRVNAAQSSCSFIPEACRPTKPDAWHNANVCSELTYTNESSMFWTCQHDWYKFEGAAMTVRRPSRPVPQSQAARPTIVRVPADAAIFRGWGVSF